jgi:hypothetical protein
MGSLSALIQRHTRTSHTRGQSDDHDSCAHEEGIPDREAWPLRWETCVMLDG